MSVAWHHVSSLLSVAVINTMAESNLEMEGFISSYCLSSFMKKSQGRSSRLESGIRSHGGMLLSGLLLRTGSPCLFVDPKTTCPRVAPPIVGWVLPHQSSIKTCL